MKLDIDAHALDIPCPGCGEKLHETIGRLKGNPKLTCPHCGERFAVNADQFRRGLAPVEESLDKLRRTLGKFGK